uniref:hypothetical protein n=1 Tax=Pseudomonas sp. K5 TaxID=1156313 RepID=UPI001D013F88
MMAVWARVLFGLAAPVRERVSPAKGLPVRLTTVGAPSRLVWTISLLPQLFVRHRANRDGTRLPFRMAGYPYRTVLGLGVLALIFGLLRSEAHT